jgi:hypothetical protein
MSFYQAVAESGVVFCQNPNKLVKCANNLAGLPAADGIVLMDAHPGNGVNALRSINPAVTNDSAVLNQNRTARINPNLDPTNPKNGFNPNGPSTYSEAFKKTYFKAQSDRMNFLIAEALTGCSKSKRAPTSIRTTMPSSCRGEMKRGSCRRT